MNTVDLIVSCPDCGKENTVSMGVSNLPFSSFVDMLMPDVKQYHMVALSVTAGTKGENADGR